MDERASQPSCSRPRHAAALSILEAILLGIVQGLTEFLPISSTAHLTLAGRALGLVDAEAAAEWTAFLAVVQLGTLVAVLAYFWRDVARITHAVVANGARRVARRGTLDALATDERVGWLIALGTVPIVVVGLALKDVIEGPLTKNLWVIAGALVLLALGLLLAERVGKRTLTLDAMGPRHALVVGLTQVIALVPGASRSGSTIMGGLFAGLERETAARFSFLLSIPAILGSAIFQLGDALDARSLGATVILTSAFAAAVAGYASIELLLRYLRKHPTHIFVAYRIVLGTMIVGLLVAGVVEAA